MQYCYTVTAVDTSNNESIESNEACATTQEGGGNSLHVDFINVWMAGAKIKKATAGVAIVDSAGAPVANSTVTGTFTGDFYETQSGVTNESGQAEIQTVGTGPATSHFTFCVDNVTYAGFEYDSDANIETCESR
jgi:hypothetical protein